MWLLASAQIILPFPALPNGSRHSSPHSACLPRLQAYKTYKLGGEISELLYSPATYGIDFSSKVGTGWVGVMPSRLVLSWWLRPRVLWLSRCFTACDLHHFTSA